jgi:hypothetical protein
MKITKIIFLDLIINILFIYLFKFSEASQVTRDMEERLLVNKIISFVSK